jgi:hypothetical protein
MNIDKQIGDLKVKFGFMVNDDRLYQVIKSIIKQRERDAVRNFLGDFTITAIYEDCKSNDEVMERWDSMPEKVMPNSLNSTEERNKQDE